MMNKLKVRPLGGETKKTDQDWEGTCLRSDFNLLYLLGKVCPCLVICLLSPAPLVGSVCGLSLTLSCWFEMIF